MFEQVRVMASLHPDAMWLRDPRPSGLGQHAPGRRPALRRAWCGSRSDERHRATLEKEPTRLPREVPEMLLAVTQGHPLMRPPHDITNEAARAILHDEPGLDLDLRVGRTGALLSELLQDVAFGSPWHRTSVTREPF